MGAYSQLDAELRYVSDAFEEDEASEGCPAFAPDEDRDDDFAGDAESPAFSEDEVEADDAAVPESAETVSRPQPQNVTQTPAPVASTQNDEVPKKESQSDADKAAKAIVDKAADNAKRKAHEEAEAKRKAEFDARQAAKKAAEKEQLDRMAAMSDDEVIAASMKRVSTDTERLTRRNMKECVAEYIQTMCIEDPAFARKVMHPRKSMIHCIWYINRQAKKYIEQEMKDNAFPKENGIYGGDVPDDLCYQWAVDYFNDPDAKEDREDEEKFVPKPYSGSTSSSSKKDKGKSKEKSQPPKKDEEKKAAPVQDKGEQDGQMSLLGVA